MDLLKHIITTFVLLLLLRPPVVFAQSSSLLTLINSGKSLMFIGAHADDANIAAPLLVRGCVAKKSKCTIVSIDRAKSPDGTQVDTEFRTYTYLLNTNGVGLGYPSGTQGAGFDGNPEIVIANWKAIGDVEGDILALINQEKPDVVITQEPTHGVYGHPDHRAIGRVVTNVFQKNSINAYLYYQIVRYSSILGGNLDPLPITDTIDERDRLPELNNETPWNTALGALRTIRFDPGFFDLIASIPSDEQISWNRLVQTPQQPETSPTPTSAPTATSILLPATTPTSIPTPGAGISLTPTPAYFPDDINHDGKVDIFDYNLLVTDFGKTGSPGFSKADLNNDGKVDMSDFNIFMASVKNQLSVSPTLILAPTPTYIPTIIPSHTVSLTSCAYKPNGAICIVNNQAGVCSHHQCIPPNHPQPTSPPVDCDSPNSPKYCNY